MLHPMLFATLVDTSNHVAETPARSLKIARIADLLRHTAPDEIEIATSFLTGAPRQGRIGLGWARFREAFRVEPDAQGDLFADDPATLTGASAETAGDPPGITGPDAAASRAEEAVVARAAEEALAAPAAGTPSLTLAEVDQAFERFSRLTGRGSAAARSRALADLLRRATAAERDFLIRLALGELRQGALAGIMEEAIAAAADLPPDEIRRAAMLSGDLRAVARAALVEGRSALMQYRLTLFQPVHFMLAQPADDIADALERLGEAGFEYKLDGARVQVHRSGAEVRVYSRRLNDVTDRVPELVEAALRLAANEFILDGEVVAFDSAGAPQPFQDTMRRFGRRLDVSRMRLELPLGIHLFDLLRLDGDDLLDRPARERAAALAALAPDLMVQRSVTADLTEAEAFYDQALAAGHEGLMAKSLDAPYQAGRRGLGWLKIKPAHTLDLVVLAAEWGHGRRAGWLSNIHLGARDPGSGGFVMLGKTFKGMTDEMLAWQTERFAQLETAREENVVHLRPEQVVEVAFGDVQESPQYPAGLALRFARVKRYRDDKPAAEADTIDAVRAIRLGQVRKSRSARKTDETQG
jgi:ATP-dependent DNA ligase I